MQKTKGYEYVKFSPKVISKAIEKLKKNRPKGEQELNIQFIKVEGKKEDWEYDTIDEFFADYQDDNIIGAWGCVGFRGCYLTIKFDNPFTCVSVESNDRAEIESVFRVFEDAVPDCTIPKPQIPLQPPWEKQVIIFIGHGRKELWRDLRDHLQDKHNFQVVAYETGARAGHEIRDVLENMLNISSFAILVFTADDKDSEGRFHARENVIHELGLFQGRLGSRKAIVLLEEGVEKFSNIEGVQYIPFPKDNIKETYGDVLATIKREFDLTQMFAEFLKQFRKN